MAPAFAPRLQMARRHHQIKYVGQEDRGIISYVAPPFDRNDSANLAIAIAIPRFHGSFQIAISPQPSPKPSSIMANKKKQKVAAPAPPKAQGTGKKRTPQSSFDPAAGKDVYEPEKIIAQRIVKGGVTQY